MAKHILLIDVPDVSNEGIFLLNDISVYTNTLPISCMNLQITPPGFGTPTVIEPTTPNFSLILNACTLGMMSSGGCGEFCPNIPDGIYNIYYSVSPNNGVWVEYQYLRITHAVNILNKLLCAVGLEECQPSREMDYELRSIDIIKNYLKSAQLSVNVLHEPEQGINLYRYALRLIEKMSMGKPNCLV